MSSARKAPPLEPPEADTLGPQDPLGRLRPRPTRTPLESARSRLGGRSVPSLSAPGSLVEATMRDGVRRAGVVLWSSREHCEAWFDDGVARRLGLAAVAPGVGAVPEGLLRVAAEIRVYVTLAEGDRVRWARGGEVAEGRIAEKCRYGAIVAGAGGRLIAVGFRKLWPVSVRAVA